MRLAKVTESYTLACALEVGLKAAMDSKLQLQTRSSKQKGNNTNLREQAVARAFFVLYTCRSAQFHPCSMASGAEWLISMMLMRCVGVLYGYCRGLTERSLLLAHAAVRQSC